MLRLKPFRYFEPVTSAEAVDTLVSEGGSARVLAGGTDLVVDMKTGRDRPSAVINLKRIPGLSGIEAGVDAITVGALARVMAIEQSSVIRSGLPALHGAASVLATPPVRRLATIGGNIGRASPASDLAPPLIVHQAVANIVGPDGVRQEPVESLYRGPGMTTLAHDEMISSVEIPHPRARSSSVHLKVGARGGGTDVAMVGVSVAVTLDGDGAVEEVRIVLASVGPTVLRAARAEETLSGGEPTAAACIAAGEAAALECEPIDDVRASATHRRALVRVLVERALHRASSVAREAQ